MTKRPPFSLHSIAMLESPAWAALSLAGRRVLDRIEIELAQHGGKDNGRLPVTWQDFERFGIHRGAIGPALRELQALGFVEITDHGVAGIGEARKPSLFRLTYRDAAGKPATDDWTNIASTRQAERIARAARQQHVKAGRRDDRTKHFPGAESVPKAGAESVPKTGAPKAAKNPAKSQGAESVPLSRYRLLAIEKRGLDSGLGSLLIPDDLRSGPRPPRQRRRRRARVRTTSHSKQEGNTHGRH